MTRKQRRFSLIGTALGVLALVLAFVHATEEALREYGRIITPLATSLDAILSALRDFGRT